MKKFYNSIARYYDFIFPLNEQQLNFIVSSMNGKAKTKSVLDIGCGTGSLSLALAKYCKRVVAIDLDPEMITMGKSKAKTSLSEVNFKCLDMLEIKEYFSPAEFDLILSFGNTVVHLGDSLEVRNFFQQARNILKSGGKLLLQIVNYNRILHQNIYGLPLINNKKIKFERYYESIPERNKIDFVTILTVKEKNQVIKNRVELYPMKKNELKNLLEGTGFRDLFFYGSFAKEEFSCQSLPLIVEAY